MSRKKYFTLQTFVRLFEKDEQINLYDQSGFCVNMRVMDIPEEMLEREVVKYKVDNTKPNIHLKLSIAS